jgi:chitosanase
MFTNFLNFLSNILNSFSSKKIETPTTNESSKPVTPEPSKVVEKNLVLSKKGKIQSILNVFETGSLKGDYSKVSIFSDGPKDIRQITYGKSQTTEWGNLRKLILKYVEKNGQYSTFFRPYLSKIGTTSLVNDVAFINKLKSAGSDSIMKEAQDEFFDEQYWNPAIDFFKKNGFTLPLSALVIYDSYIHSGSVPIFLRKRFSELPPVSGGDEKKWVEQYLVTRQDWLSKHSRPILRSTTYRTKNMLVAVREKNWNLDKPFYANGVIAQGVENNILSTKIIGINVE